MVAQDNRDPGFADGFKVTRGKEEPGMTGEAEAARGQGFRAQVPGGVEKSPENVSS